MKDEEPLALDIDSRSRINVTTLRTNSALKKASFRWISRPLRQKTHRKYNVPIVEGRVSGKKGVGRRKGNIPSRMRRSVNEGLNCRNRRLVRQVSIVLLQVITRTRMSERIAMPRVMNGPRYQEAVNTYSPS